MCGQRQHQSLQINRIKNHAVGGGWASEILQQFWMLETPTKSWDVDHRPFSTGDLDFASTVSMGMTQDPIFHGGTVKTIILGHILG